MAGLLLVCPCSLTLLTNLCYFANEQNVIDSLVGSSGTLSVGKYLVCFRSGAAGAFIGSGITLTLQDQILALEVNDVRPNLGLDISLPKASGVQLRYIRSSPGVAGDSIALIPPMADCASLCRSKTIPSCDPASPEQYSVTGILSAHSPDSTLSSIPCVGFFTTSVSCQPSNQTRFVNLENVAEGTYKVCYRPASATSFSLDWPVWRSLGIRATVQASVVGFNLNDVGLPTNVLHGQRLAAPRVQGQKLKYYGSAASGEIALAVGYGYCASIVGSAMSAQLGVGISQAAVDSFLGGQAGTAFGQYQFCFRANSQQPWISTGVSLLLQGDIEQLDINGVRPNYGVRISVPVQTGNRLRMVRSVGEQVAGDRVSLLRPELSCKNPQHNTGPPSARFSGYLNLVSSRRILADPELVFNDTIVFRDMQVGLYKLCFAKLGSTTSVYDTGFTETGITVTVQSGLTFLRANERLWGAGAVPTAAPQPLDFGKNRGIRVALPKADLNLVIASNPGTLSFIPSMLDCQDASPAGDNAPTAPDGRKLHIQTDSVTAVLPSRQFDLVMGSTNGYRATGVYQVCYKPPGGSWAASGISLNLQDSITGLIINDIMPNAGIRVSLPRIEGNTISMLGRTRAGGNVGDKISFISVHGDCQDVDDNPELHEDAVPPGPHPLQRVPSGHFEVGTDLRFSGVDEIALQNVGVYKVCYYSLGADTFSDTGITARVQDEFVRFQVNEVQLQRSGVPKTSNNDLGYCVDAACLNPGAAGDAVSVISFDKECEDTDVQNPSKPAAGISGHLIVDDTSRHLPNERGDDPERVVVDDAFGTKGVIGAGYFQLCFRSAATGIFQSTGLSLRVQQDILKISLNNVSPNYGLRVAVPWGDRNLPMSFQRFYPGTAGDSISLISLTGDCKSEEDNPATPSAQRSGHVIKTVGTENILIGTEVIGTMDAMRYQVCFHLAEQDLHYPSGISLKIQDLVESAASSDSSRGVDISMSKKAGESLTLFGQTQSTITKVSLILGQRECKNIDAYNFVEPGLGRSGWWPISGSAAGGGVQVAVTDEVLTSRFALMPMTFQLCVSTASGWQSTGIAVKVVWPCKTAGVETVFGHPGSGQGLPPALFVRESVQMLGAVNAVHIIMRPLATIPEGGVLTISGLGGSLTDENPQFDVFGNTVESRELPLPCVGNRTCTAELKNYVENAQMVLSAFLTVEIACTNLDACGERVESVKINGNGLGAGEFDAGPWQGCVAQCGTRRELIKNRDITDLLGVDGRDFRVDVVVSDKVLFYTCNGASLDATVRVTLLMSNLSTNVIQGAFTQTTGEIVIPLVPYDANPYIHVTLPLRNPSVQLRPKLPTVEICPQYDGGGKVARMAAVQFPPEPQGGVLTGSTAAKFTYIEIKESSVFPDQVNRFKLLLRANIPFLMSDALAVTVSGLTGTQSLDKSDFPLLTDGSFESRLYDCSGARDCQVVIDANPSRGILHRAQLDIDIFCTDFEMYPSKYVEYVKICGDGGGACGNVGTVSISTDKYRRGPWQGCSGCGRSTRKVLENYDLQDILKFYPNRRITLDVGVSAGVSNLPCYLTNGGVQTVKAIVRVTLEFVQDTGNWQEREGSLTFKALPSITQCSTPIVPDGDLSCLPQIQLQFEVKNPERAQDALVPTISAQGGGLFFAEQQLQPVLGILPSFEIDFVSASISERSRIMGIIENGVGMNRLVVSFKTSAPLIEGTLVTIIGLTGTQTASKPCTPVAEPSCSDTSHCIFSPSDSSCQRGLALSGFNLGSHLSASWDQSTGTLVFAVQKSFHMVSSFELSFELMNAAAAQAPASPTIRASSSTSIIPSFAMSGSVLSSGLLVELEKPVVPEFVVNDMGESNKVEFQENTINMDLMWDVPLRTGTIIELSSLAYTQFTPSPGGSLWYDDAKENVALIPVEGQLLEEVAKWQGSTREFSAWTCEEGGWGGSRWCTVQQANTVQMRLRECLHAGTLLSAALTLRNGAQVSQSSSILPTISVRAGTMSIEPTAPILKTFTKKFERNCEGPYTCTASFVHDNACFNETCRFLPQQALIKSATMTIDLACSSFDQAQSYLEDVSMCLTPDCSGLYGDTYSWNQEFQQCCTYTPSLICEPYSCTTTVSSFDKGPWKGCANNCSASKAVIKDYDIMPIICSGQEAECFAPKNPVVGLIISAGADSYSCSLVPGVYTTAKVTLKIDYGYKSVLSATEASRFDIAVLEESSQVTSAMNTLTLKMTCRVSVVAGSKISISGLGGSQTKDMDSITIESLSCDPIATGGYFCTSDATAGAMFGDVGTWKQDPGVLVAKVIRDVSGGEVLAFRFRILNANAPQAGKWSSVTVVDQGGSIVIPQQDLSPSVLSSGATAMITEGNAFEDSKVMQNPNEILVVFRTNFDVDGSTRLSVSGLTGSLTKSAQNMTVSVNEVDTSAGWDQESGTMTIVVPNDIMANTTTKVRFTILNGWSLQLAPALTLTVSVASSATDRAVSAPLKGNVLAGGTLPSFIEPYIVEQKKVTMQPNLITVSFSLNVALAAGSKLLITGLTGSDTLDDDARLVYLTDGECDNIYSVPSSWRVATGSLNVFLPVKLKTKTKYSIQFTVRNSIVPQAAPTVRIGAASISTTVAFTTLAGTVFTASERAGFAVAEISQSSGIAGATNRITVQLDYNFDLDPETFIYLKGLTSPSASDNDLAVTAVFLAGGAPETRREGGGEGASEGGTPVSVRGQWDQPSGTLTISEWPEVSAPASVTVQFLLQNPASPQSSQVSSVSVSRLHGHTGELETEVEATAMVGSVLSGQADGSITSFTVTESSTVQSSRNRITCTFVLNFALSFGAKITLTGLTGTSVPANPNLQIRGPSAALFGGAGSWDTTGRLVLQVSGPRIVESGKEVIFSFGLINRASLQAAVIPSLQLPELAAAPRLSSSEGILSAAQGPTFLQASISETTQVLKAINNLNIRCRCSADLPPGSKITVSGLEGALPLGFELSPDSPAQVSLSTFGSQVASAYWVVETGEVVLTLAEDVAVGAVLDASFEMTNPDERQRAITTTRVSASGIDETSTPFVIQSVPLVGSVLSSSIVPAFTFTDIYESSQIAGGSNTLTITLSANTVIREGETIFLTNFKGSLTEDSDALAIVSPDNFLAPTAIWRVEEGSLKLVATSSIPRYQTFSFSFTLVNPFPGQTPVVPEAYTAIIAKTAVLSKNMVWNDGNLRWRGSQPPEESNGQVLSGVDNNRWLTAKVRQLSRVANLANTVFLELVPNTNLNVGALITVSGLVGTQEPDSATMTLGGKLPGGTTGTWVNNLGRLTFSLPVTVAAGDTLSFSIPLSNPEKEQPPVTPSIELQMNGPIGTIVFPEQPLSPVDGCCLSADDSPRFITASARERTNVPGQLNEIHIELAANVIIDLGMQITVSGLTGTPNQNNPAMVVSDDPSLLAPWDQDSGTVTVSVAASMYYCECLDACDRNSLLFSIRLLNPLSPQSAPTVQVGASRSGLTLARTQVSADILTSTGSALLTGKVSEQTNVTSLDNIITIEAMSNVEMSTCKPTWLNGVTSWITSSECSSESECAASDVLTCAAGRGCPAAGLKQVQDNLKTTSVDVVRTGSTSMNIQLDMGQDYSVSQFSVLGSNTGSSVKRCQLQFALSASAPESEWLDAGGLIQVVQSDGQYTFSALFESAITAQHWRLVIIDNWDDFAALNYVTISEVQFYACPDVQTASIVVRGLEGTRTPSNSRMPIFGQSSRISQGVRNTGIWIQETGSLYVKVLKSVPTFDIVKFQFMVANADSAQRAMKPSIQLIDAALPVPESEAFGTVLESNEERLISVREISESSGLQGDVNVLSIRLKPNVPMTTGQKLRVVFDHEYLPDILPDKTGAGFDCPAIVTPKDVPCISGDLAADGDVTFSYRSKTNEGEWTDNLPSVIIELNSDFPLNFLFSFTLQVQNPSGKKDGLVPMTMGTTLKSLPMTSSVMSAPSTPTLIATTIGESSSMAGAINYLTVTMVPSITLSAGNVVTISGLTGTLKPPFIPEPSANCALIDTTYATASPSDLFQFPFSWSLLGCFRLGNPAVPGADNGGVAEITLASDWPSGQAAVLSWPVRNGFELRERESTVQVVAQQGITVPRLACKTLKPDEEGVCLEQADVLNVDRVGGLLLATASESTLVQGQENLITVSLQASMELVVGTLITVSGLTGTQSADSVTGDRVPLRDGFGDAFSLTLESWSKDTGVIVLRALASLTSVAKTSLSFRLALINGAAEQSPPLLQIQVTPPAVTNGACGVLVCDIMGLGSYATVTSGSISDLVPLQVPPGGILSYSQVATLLNTLVTETSGVPDQDNVITLSIGANLFIRSGTLVTFTGLVGSQTPDNPSLSVFINDQGAGLNCNVGNWQQGPGTLAITLCRDLPAATPVNVTVVLRNPASARPSAATPLVSLVYSVIRILNFPMSGAVLQGADMQRIVSISAAEDTTVVSQPNTVSITFSATVPLTRGTEITIADLAGFDTEVTCSATASSFALAPAEVKLTQGDSSSEDTVMTSERSVTAATGADGACVASASSIKFALPRGFDQYASITASLKLKNAPTPTSGGIPSISISGCRSGLFIPPGANRQDVYCSHGTYTELRGFGTGACSAVDQLTGSGEGAGGEPPPCSTLCQSCGSLTGEVISITATPASQRLLQGGGQPAFTATYSESTNVLSQPNAITVVIRSNVVVPRLTSITLSGLSGSQTLSDPLLPLTGADAQLFLGSANWKQSGLLVMTLDSDLEVQQEVSVSFTLLNKNRQDEAECRNGEKYCTKDGGGSLREGLPCSIAGRACSGQCISGQQFCYGGDPTQVSGDCTSINMLIPENVREANKLCVGSLCTLPNKGYQCPAGALVTMTNATTGKTSLVEASQLKGKLFVDYAGRTRVISSENCNGGGTCDNFGTCTEPNTYQKCTAHSECTGFTGGQQRCMRVDRPLEVVISMGGSTLTFPPQPLIGTVLGLTSPYQPEFVLRTISETSSTPGSENILTVSLSSNFPLQEVEETIVTISGLVSGSPSNPKLPVYSASMVIESFPSCDVTTSGVTCRDIGQGLVPSNGIIITAELSIYVNCGSGSASSSGCGCSTGVSGECAGMITKVTTPCGTQPEGFAPLPCLDRIGCTDDGFCKAVQDMNVLSFLVDNPDCGVSAGQGFEISSSPARGFGGARAHLTVRYSNESVSWNRPGGHSTSGTLVVNGSAAPSIKSDDRNLIFSFMLSNRDYPAPAPELIVTAVSGSIERVGLCEDRIDVGCTQADEPSRARAIISGNVLTASRQDYFDKGLIFESSQISGSDNTITIYLVPFEPLAPGTIITVTGLKGSASNQQSASLSVLGAFTSNFGQWGTTSPDIPCCDTLIAKVVPRPIEGGAIILSFLVRNSAEPQSAQKVAVLATGSDKSTGGFDTPLVCATSLDCQGVLSAITPPSVVSAAAYEKNRYISKPNVISLSLRSNCDLHARGSTVTVSGLRSEAFSQGVVALVSSEASKQTVGACDGSGACVFSIDSSVPDGATLLQRAIVLSVQCKGLHRLMGVKMCGISWGPSPLPYNCSETSSSFDVAGDMPLDCTRLGSSIVEITSDGILSVSAKLDTYFSLGSPDAGVATWSGTELVVTVAQNLTQGSVTLTDPTAFAFSFSILNSAVVVDPVQPTFKATSQGRAVTGMAATRKIMGAKVNECRVGDLLLGGLESRFPAGNLNAGNFDDCAVIVQPADRRPQDLVSTKTSLIQNS